MLDRARGEVARVGVELLPGRRALGIDALKFRLRQVDLAADLHQLRRGAPEFLRQRADGPHIRRHVITAVTLAPGHGPHELAVLVRQAHGQPVDLRLHGVAEVVGPEQPGEPGVKCAQLGLVVSVVEAEHLLAVRHLLETLHPVVARALRGRILRQKLREFLLQLRQFPLARIILEIGNLRFGLLEIQRIIPRDLRAQVGDPLLGLGRGHPPNGIPKPGSGKKNGRPAGPNLGDAPARRPPPGQGKAARGRRAAWGKPGQPDYGE